MFCYSGNVIAVVIVTVPAVVFVDMVLKQPGLRQVVSKLRGVENKASWC